MFSAAGRAVFFGAILTWIGLLCFGVDGCKFLRSEADDLPFKFWWRGLHSVLSECPIKFGGEGLHKAGPGAESTHRVTSPKAFCVAPVTPPERRKFLAHLKTLKEFPLLSPTAFKTESAASRRQPTDTMAPSTYASHNPFP